MSCPDCFKGVTLDGESTGTISKFSNTGIDAYFAAGPEGSDPTKAVVLLTDVFGLPLKNSKILADSIAREVGCDVWVPDLFNGNPPVAHHELKTPERPGEKFGFFGYLSLFWLLLRRWPRMLSIRASVVDPITTKFVTKLREEKKYEKVGAVGYCLGGAICIRLGSTDLFNSLVIAHPGGSTIDQVKAIKVPSSWACAEEDMSFKTPYRKECEAELASRKGKDNFVEYEFKDYPGTTHGFAARPNLEYPDVKAGFEGAFKQTVEWFKKTLA